MTLQRNEEFKLKLKINNFKTIFKVVHFYNYNLIELKLLKIKKF